MLLRSRLSLCFAALCSLVALQACAVSAEHSNMAAEPLSIASAQPASELDSLREGDVVVFRTGLLAAMGPVTIGREYRAASGRRCKRILGEFGIELIAVACEAQQDRWYLRQST